ncbi:MAG: hypothetical protein ACQERC_08360 [Bacteroidota bacterium]
MNKRILFVGIAALAIGVTSSCKKDYECHCHLDDMQGNHMDEEMMIENEREEDAKAACDEFKHSFEDSGNYEEVDCSLK